MGQYRRRHKLDRVERPAGHLEKADLERQCQAVHRPATLPHRRRLGIVVGEEEVGLQLSSAIRNGPLSDTRN